jgi:hypothetical protein
VIAGDRDGLQGLVASENVSTPTRKSIWDKLGLHPFRGMWKDIHRRIPYYLTDWTDAWTYRVIPSTVDMYFKKYVSNQPSKILMLDSLLPAIAFALDMFRETNNNFGVNEVLLSSVFAAVMFAMFAGQPLVIVGVTGNTAP